MKTKLALFLFILSVLLNFQRVYSMWELVDNNQLINRSGNSYDSSSENGNPVSVKPRLLVLTDIGGDPDDIQSLRRLLVYANEFKLEGFVATSTWGGREIRQPGVFHVFENLIHDAINDYEPVRDNLMKHSAGYPDAAVLRTLVHRGQPYMGVENLSPGSSTNGSKHIIQAVDASEQMLNIAIWGGAHDLAQALLDVRTSRTEAELNLFLSKIRVYAIGDQDKKRGVLKGTGEWIRENFPALWYIEAGPPWNAGYQACYRGMYQNESAGGVHPELPLVREGVEALNDSSWVADNVISWGPLGAGYPSLVNQNPNSRRNTKGVKEGDTPSWFYFLSNGLNFPDHPEWGGWGGRFEHFTARHYVDAQDHHWSGNEDAALRRKWVVARWREAFQNDFAARMQWCQLNYSEANHNPVAVIDKDDSRRVFEIKAKAGQTIRLDASASYDPDGNKLSFKWWVYQEPSSTIGIVKKGTGPKAMIEIPEVAPDGILHVILEVTDNGTPSLTSYRRILIKISR